MTRFDGGCPSKCFTKQTIALPMLICNYHFARLPPSTVQTVVLFHRLTILLRKFLDVGLLLLGSEICHVVLVGKAHQRIADCFVTGQNGNHFGIELLLFAKAIVVVDLPLQFAMLLLGNLVWGDAKCGGNLFFVGKFRLGLLPKAVFHPFFGAFGVVF